jgi:hypothetical protein
MAAITRLGLFGVTAPGISTAQSEALSEKNVYVPGMRAQRIPDFDLWQADYGGARVYVYKANTTDLAALYSDIGLTTPLDNPQTLLSRSIAGRSYGKWDAPVYTPDSYYLDINAVDQTGVSVPPLTTLDGEDADLALVTANGGSEQRALEAHLAQTVWAEDHGALGDSPTENAATLNAAMGEAGARGGASVQVPAGNWQITQITVPSGVTLKGQGRLATTLRSTVAGNVITFSGDNCGLSDLTVDGVNVVAGSVGVYSKGLNEIRLTNAEVKRFETGILFRGGARARFDDVSVQGCTTGARLTGHLDTSGGSAFTDFVWVGGEAKECSSAAIWLEYIDRTVWHNFLANLSIHDNIQDGLKITGAQFTRISHCLFDDNSIGLRVEDDSPATGDSVTINLHVEGGRFDASDVRLDGACQDVQFEDVRFLGAEIRAETTIENQILLIDCSEDATTTIAGDGTRVMRWRSNDRGAVRGTTANATPTKAMGFELEPGESALLVMKAVANQVDGEGYAMFYTVHAARRDTADLTFDNGTIAFLVGQTVVGATSGSSAYITAVAGTTASGTLSLRAITGEFTDNESLQVGGVTNALANGVLVYNAPSVVGTSAASVFAHRTNATASDNTISAVGNEIQVMVTGVASRTFEWVVDVEKVSA